MMLLVSRERKAHGKNTHFVFPGYPFVHEHFIGEAVKQADCTTPKNNELFKQAFKAARFSLCIRCVRIFVIGQCGCTVFPGKAKTPVTKNAFCVNDMLNNIFDKKYAPNGYTYTYVEGGKLQSGNGYYPMAGTTFFAGVTIGF